MVYRPNTEVSGDRCRRVACRRANERRFLGDSERTANENSRLSPNITKKETPMPAMPPRGGMDY